MQASALVETVRNGIAAAASKFQSDPPPQNPGATTAPDETEVVSEVTRLYQSARDRRQWLDLEWARNLAYLEGKHWLRIDRGSKRLAATDPLDDVLYAHTINHIRRVCLTVVNLSTQNKPDAQPLPLSDLDIDQKAADEADAVLGYTDQRLAPMRLRERAVYWALATGGGWRTAWWDEHATAELQTKEGVITDAYLGNACGEIVPTFELFIDPQADCWERARWVIRETVRPVSWCREQYGKKAESVSTDARMIDGLMGFATPFFLDYRPDEQTKNGVRVLELWEKPSPKFKKGRRVVVAGGKVMEYGENPYNDKAGRKCLPFVPTYYQDAVGHPYGLSLINDLIDPQDEYNRLWSKALSRIEKAKAYIAIPETSQSSPKSVHDSREMGVITWDPIAPEGMMGQPPFQVISPPPLVGELVPMCQALQDQIEGLAGARPIAQGQTNGQGQLSGLAIDLLQQANNTQHNQLRENIEQGECEFKEWFVFLYAKFAGPAPRLLGLDQNNNPEERKPGQQGNQTLEALRNGGACRVRVTPGSAAARTPAAQRAFVIELRGMGVFGPFEAPEQVRSVKRFVEALNDVGSAKILRQLDEELERLEAEQNVIQQMGAVIEQQQSQIQEMGAALQELSGVAEQAQAAAQQPDPRLLAQEQAEQEAAAREHQAMLDAEKRQHEAELNAQGEVLKATLQHAMPSETGNNSKGGSSNGRR